MIFRFGAYELDEELFELRHDGQPLAVQPRGIDALFHLVRHRDRVVTKDELVAGPWNGLAVTDAALGQVIRLLRRALGDDAAAPAMIATVRGRGFRFVHEVSEQHHGPERAQAAPRAERESAPSVAPLRAAAPSRTFAGRRDELGALHAALAEAQSGHGSLIVLHGAAGMGKTSVAERFAEDAVAAGFDVHWGRCWEAQGTPPFWPWPELLQSYVERHGLSLLRDLAQGSMPQLATLLPELAAAPGSAEGAASEGPYKTFRVLDAVCKFWRRCAQNEPLVVFLEDLHLADEAALTLLELVCRSIGQSRLLLVATCRTREAGSRPVLRAALEGALPHVSCIELRGLPESDVAGWLAALAGAQLGSRIPGLVQRATGGHPLLIGNLVRRLPRNFTSDDLSLLRELRAPEPIAASIRAELGRLSAPALALLGLASILGEVISLPALAELARATLSDTMLTLQEAIHAGFLLLAAGGRLRFSHALLQDTLYHDLDPGQRQDLHRAAGQAFRERLAEHPEYITQAAYHFMAAMPRVDLDDALALSLQAAEWARRHVAYGQAVEYYARALQLLELGEISPRRKAELLRELGRMQHLAGHSDDAVRSYGDLYELSRRNDFHDLEAAALLGHYETRLELTISEQAFHVRLRETLSRVKQRDDWYCKLLAVRVAVAYTSEPAATRRLWLEEALSLSLVTRDPATRLTVLHATSRAYIDLGDVQRLLAFADELIELGTALEVYEILVDAGEWRASCLLELGWGKEFSNEVSRCGARAARIGHPQFLYSSKLLESARAGLQGDRSGAESLARAAWSIGAPLQGMAAECWFAIQLFALALEAEGDTRVALLRESLEHTEAVATCVPGFDALLVQAACLHCELGARERASVMLAQLEDEGTFPVSPVDRFFLPSLAQLTLMARALERRSALRVLQRALLPYSGRHVQLAMANAYLGPVSYWLGLIALELDSPAEARMRLEQAGRESERSCAKAYGAWADFHLPRLIAPAAQ